MYKIILDKSKALKKDMIFLKKNKDDEAYVKEMLSLFAQNPLESLWNVKKLEPKEQHCFRLKLRNIRVLFTVDHGNKIIILTRIAYRKDAYK